MNKKRKEEHQAKGFTINNFMHTMRSSKIYRQPETARKGR